MDLLAYIQPRQGYLWQWEDQHTVLAIPGGNTIAYGQMVLEMLESFGDQPIPRLTPLLLVLAATNPSAAQDLPKIAEILEGLRSRKFLTPVTDRETNEDIMKLMHSIQKLGVAAKQGPRRQQLVQMLFANGHKMVSHKNASTLLHQWRSAGPPADLVAKYITGDDHGPIWNDLRGLAIIQNRYPTTEAIQEALSQLVPVEPLALDPSPAKSTASEDLVEALKAETKTYKIGALVPHLWAGLNIPYHLSLPGGQPLGGVSDLTNKGDLERLLISEYANDDEVFLSRLANNEALYLRREEPPASEEFHRIILIDISLKNWGTPKLLALSVLVAIANHPKTDIECTAFAVGNRIYPIDHTTVPGIMDAHHQLASSLHCEQGLEHFLQKRLANQHTEIFFISTKEATDYPEMHRVLNDYHDRFTYWINVEHDGRVRLYKNRHRSKHLLQEFTVPLERLWAKSKAKATPRELPEVQDHPYPILFPLWHNSLVSFQLHKEDPVYVALRKGIFKVSPNNYRGMTLLKRVDYLQKNCRFAIMQHASGTIWLTFSPQRKTIFLENLNTGESTSLGFVNWQDSSDFPHFFGYEGTFYYLLRNKSYKITWEGKPKLTFENGIPANLQEAYGINYHRHLFTMTNPFSKISSVAIGMGGFLYLNGLSNNKIDNSQVQTIELRNGRSAELNPFGDMEWVNFKSLNEKIVAANKVEGSLEFRFLDGSEIQVDPFGIILFRSSNPQIDDFYLSMITNGPTAGATQTVFAGPKELKATNTIAETVSPDHFYKAYVLAFGQTILEWYAANA